MIRRLEAVSILVVEDEALLAFDLAACLEAEGATIVGPVATVAEAMAIIERSVPVRCAVLDINLRGEMVFVVADALIERGVPFVFATGYDDWIIPPRYATVLRLQKPTSASHLIAALCNSLFQSMN